MTNELKACPFCRECDAEFKRVNDDGEGFVRCHSCLMYGPLLPSRTLAIQAWNTRPEEDRLRSAVEELVGALREQREWIDNWSPNFTDDAAWPETDMKVSALLSKHGGK